MGGRDSGSNDTWCLAHFFSCLVFLSVPLVSLPASLGLYRYLLPILRVVSSVRQVSVLLQHICSCSCSLYALVLHYSTLLSAFLSCLVLMFIVLYLWFGVFCCILDWLFLLRSRVR